MNVVSAEVVSRNLSIVTIEIDGKTYIVCLRVYGGDTISVQNEFRKIRRNSKFGQSLLAHARKAIESVGSAS